MCPRNCPAPSQVKETLEQIDLVKSIVARYPNEFALARTAADVMAARKAGKIASMKGAEGGGQIDESFSVLRAYKELGVGYLTLTHSKTIDWADSATDDPKHDGLTPFGIAVVHELNRLGMLVDLAHVSEGTMLSALKASKAPGHFFAFGRPRTCRLPAQCQRRGAEEGRRKWRRGDGHLRARIYQRGAAGLGFRAQRAQYALQQPALRRPLYRPAGQAKAARAIWKRIIPGRW